jgi:tRNA(Arg) A34 adenosine deaminase TadA
MDGESVRQLRLVLWVDDLDQALGYFRDALGLSKAEAFDGPDGARVVIMNAGRATLELINAAQNRYIAEVENAPASTPRVRAAFEVHDAAAAAQALADAGMPLVAAPVRTPWNSLNARLAGVAEVPVTLFQELGETGLIGAQFAALGGEAGLLASLVDLATANAVAGALPFSAAVVRDGLVIGVGVNTERADADVSAHGEVTAVRDAAARTGSRDLTGAIVYASCEPCALCRVAAAASGIMQIVFAAGRELVAPGPGDAVTHALMDAVAEQLPGIARRGHTTLDATALAAPFHVLTETS